MNHTLLRSPVKADADALLEGLTHQQFLNPHQPLKEALEAARQKLDLSPQAVQHALGWLQIDQQIAIGRLRRTEVTQLARCIYRFWEQALDASQPS